MLREVATSLSFCNGLRGRVLDGAALLRDELPREWLCHAGDYMIVVRYQEGVLGMGVGETEHETYNEIKIIGMNDGAEDRNKISFHEIKTFMDWTLDDDDWFE